MTIELDNDTRRVLGLAVQSLEDMAEWAKPRSNMADMRSLLAGKSSGRDSQIIVEAIAVALAHRTVEIVNVPLNDTTFRTRLDEFTALFDLLQRADTPLLALRYVAICDLLGRGRDDLEGTE